MYDFFQKIFSEQKIYIAKIVVKVTVLIFVLSCQASILIQFKWKSIAETLDKK